MDRGPLALRLESWAFRVGLHNRWGGVDATSIHASISSLTVPLLSPSGVNY